jgi:hypothetical protein
MIITPLRKIATAMVTEQGDGSKSRHRLVVSKRH